MCLYRIRVRFGVRIKIRGYCTLILTFDAVLVTVIVAIPKNRVLVTVIVAIPKIVVRLVTVIVLVTVLVLGKIIVSRT